MTNANYSIMSWEKLNSWPHPHICLEELKELISPSDNNSYDFGDDPYFIRDALEKNSRAFSLASRRIQNDKEFVSSLLTYDKNRVPPFFHPDGIFIYLSSKLKDDKDIVECCIRKNPNLIEHASLRCRDDPNIMRLAVGREPTTITYCSQRLLNDPNFIMTVMKQNGSNSGILVIMKHISINLQDNKSIVLFAVQKDGLAIEYATERLRDDKDIASAAIISNARASIYLSKERFLNNKHFMMIATKRNQFMLQYASESLFADKDFLLWAFKLEGHCISTWDAMQFASSQLKDDKEIVKEAVCKNGRLVQYASIRLQNDKEIVLFAVEKDGMALAYASSRLRNDWDVVSTAIQENCQAIQYVSKRLLNNEDFALMVIQHQAATLSRSKRGGTFEVMGHMPNNIRCNRKVILAAINKFIHDGQGLKYACPSLKNDLQVVLQAVTVRASSFQYASIEKQNNPQVIGQALLHYNYPPNSVSDFLRFYCNVRIKTELELVIQTLRKREEEYTGGVPIHFINQSSVLSYADKWFISIRETAWLINQAIPDCDAARKVVEFTGIQNQLSDVRHLRYTAPVLGAIAQKGIDWKDIHKHV